MALKSLVKPTSPPSSGRGKLQQCKSKRIRSHRRWCGFLKKIYPTVFEKTWYLWTEITNKKYQRLHCDVGNTQRIHGTEAITACCLLHIDFKKNICFILKPQKRRAWHFVSRVLLYLFSFCSDFSCKYVITVNASNAYVTSKTVQNCSYCIC